MIRTKMLALPVAAAALMIGAAACSSSSSPTASSSHSSKPMASSSATTDAKPFGAACSSVPKSGKGSFSGMSSAPVATAASANPVLSTLVTAVEKAGLVNTLNSAKSLTVFAPDNAAFAAIPKATLAKVLANKALLTKILTYHVAAGTYTPAQLASGTPIKTLEGSTVTPAKMGSSYTVNDASVVCGDVHTANATVYIVNTVLMPPAAAATTSDFGPACSSVPKSGKGSFSGMSSAPVATAASANPLLSTLVTAVKKAGLVNTLNSASSLTVFAPDNAAFAAIPKATLAKVLANKAELTKILTYHVISGRRTPADLASGVPIKTLEGTTVMPAQSMSGAFTVNGAKVLCGNVQTSNATVYIINKVLMPKM